MGKILQEPRPLIKLLFTVALYYAVRKRALALNWRADRSKDKNIRRIILSL